MSDIIKKLSEPLSSKDVYIYAREIARDSRGKYFGLFLVYKTSRSVIERLNNVLGLDWWDAYYYDENHILCCKLSVKEGDKVVTREGVGTSKLFEKEKASRSDALKVASVKFGIGIELYKMPKLVISLKDSEVTPAGKINVKEVDFRKWEVKYDYKDGEVKDLKIYDEKGELRWG